MVPADRGHHHMAKKKAARRDSSAPVRTEAQERIHREWALRHPARAAQERTFRKGRATMLERFGHKNAGTPETHQAHAQRRAGAIARLHASGYLNDDEAAWAEEIAAAAERVMAGVGVRTANHGDRVDSIRHGHDFYEALGAVWSEMAYSRWRAQLGQGAALVLDVVVHDIGIARAAATHGMHVRRARRLLTDALNLWSAVHRRVRDEVTPADLAAAQAGLG